MKIVSFLHEIICVFRKLFSSLHLQMHIITKVIKNMENTEINIRGSINRLGVNEKIHLPKALCRISSVRTIAGMITADYGKVFNVTGVEDKHNIIVTRTA